MTCNCESSNDMGGDTGDFAIDFDDRGMDSNQSDHIHPIIRNHSIECRSPSRTSE
jgi:hypothetical protein